MHVFAGTICSAEVKFAIRAGTTASAGRTSVFPTSNGKRDKNEGCVSRTPSPITNASTGVASVFLSTANLAGTIISDRGGTVTVWNNSTKHELLWVVARRATHTIRNGLWLTRCHHCQL